MSYMKCCVPGCPASTGSQSVLHAFPNPTSDLERFKSWIFHVGGDISQLPDEYIYKNRCVCRSHFEARYLCRCNRLSKIAIPTVNMPDFLTSDTSREHLPSPELQYLSVAGPSASVDIPEQSANTNEMVDNASVMPVKNICSQPLCQQIIATSRKRSHELEANKLYETETKKKRIQVSHFAKRIMMTECEKKLYNNLLRVKIKLCKYKNMAKKRLQEVKTAQNLSSNPAFVKVMESLPKTAKILTLLQFRELSKKEKGRRFNIQEKTIALSILKQSPKAYRFLRKIFVLSSPQTLIKLLAKANIAPGINKKIFAQLQTKAKGMKMTEKLCVLLFDEMSLKTNVSYNERKDKVTGFVTNGSETRPIFANHAQVFMIRGLVKNFKQPVSYTFSSGATKGPELAKQIKEVISQLHKTGFRVVATVCDQGTNNRQAVKLLVEEARGIFLRRGEVPKHNVFLIDEQEIVPLYDSPHLLKGIRNNLLTKDLQFEIDGKVKIAKWHHLMLLHKENPGYKGIRLLPKLTDNHVVPQKIGKMKVKYASQIFSETVASNMGYLADKGVLPKECQDTADLLLFVDKLFDSVNGSYTKKRFVKPLLGPVTPKSCHHKIWNDARKILKSMVFVHASGKKESVPTVNNWVWTLEATQVLQKKMETEYSITSIWMRHLNQDPVENFFGAIRSHGCRNTNPTPELFEAAYTTLLINSLTSVHAPGGNCENDLGETLFALIAEEDCKADSNIGECEIDLDEVLHIETEPIENKRNNPKIWAPLQYVSGYFVHKSKKVFKNCSVCQKTLVNNQELEYIRYREYSGRRWLCSPSDSVVNLISHLQDTTTAILKKELEKPNLRIYIKTVNYLLVKLNTFSDCEIHKDALTAFLMNLVIRFFIYNYCKNINKILCGRKDVDDEGNPFQVMAKDNFKKSQKIKK